MSLPWRRMILITLSSLPSRVVMINVDLDRLVHPVKPAFVVKLFVFLVPPASWLGTIESFPVTVVEVVNIMVLSSSFDRI